MVDDLKASARSVTLTRYCDGEKGRLRGEEGERLGREAVRCQTNASKAHENHSTENVCVNIYKQNKTSAAL